ncbi:MAG: prepilin-type N-terminal cleavage/methylation domain-containing protein [Myxococcota bacterium]
MRPRRGFTLIELMMVVAIAGTLAAIAVPRYRTAQMTARRSETYTVLGIARQAQYAWFAQWDCFAAFRQTPEVGFPPSGTVRPWISTLTGIADRCLVGDYSFRDADIVPSRGNLYHFFECERNAPGGTPDFTCSAVGDLDNDGNLSEYIYCTDHASSGACVASSAGTVSLFPFTVLTANVGTW